MAARGSRADRSLGRLSCWSLLRSAVFGKHCPRAWCRGTTTMCGFRQRRSAVSSRALSELDRRPCRSRPQVGNERLRPSSQRRERPGRSSGSILGVLAVVRQLGVGVACLQDLELALDQVEQPVDRESGTRIDARLHVAIPEQRDVGDLDNQSHSGNWSNELSAAGTGGQTPLQPGKHKKRLHAGSYAPEKCPEDTWGLVPLDRSSNAP